MELDLAAPRWAVENEQRLKAEVCARLRVVCSDWEESEFDALVDKVVRNTLSFTMLPRQRKSEEKR